MVAGRHDMWEDRHPGIDVVPLIFYSANFYAERSVAIIKNHSRLYPPTHTHRHHPRPIGTTATTATTPTVVDLGANVRAAVEAGVGSEVGKTPLFLYLPIQNVHAPYQMPPGWESGQYPAMWDNTYVAC